MDLYYQLPVNHPLRLALPEESAKVAIGYWNLTPYRIILWKRLLNFLLKDGSLDQVGYDRLKLPLPADEDALKAWVYCMVNYAATVPGGVPRRVVRRTLGSASCTSTLRTSPGATTARGMGFRA